MRLYKLKGIVGDVRYPSPEGYRAGARQRVSLHVRGRAVQIALRGVPVIMPGDHVTVVAQQRRGVFHALAFRNNENRATCVAPAWSDYVMGALLLMLALPLMLAGRWAILAGALLAVAGVLLWLRGYRRGQAQAVLRDD